MCDLDGSISLHRIPYPPPPPQHTQTILLQISTDLEDPPDRLKISGFPEISGKVWCLIIEQRTWDAPCVSERSIMYVFCLILQPGARPGKFWLATFLLFKMIRPSKEESNGRHLLGNWMNVMISSTDNIYCLTNYNYSVYSIMLQMRYICAYIVFGNYQIA